MARKTETRDRLVETATKLFSKQGYGQTGVNEIMNEAQATSGSFYHFFPAKEDLLLAVLDRIGENLDAEMFGPAERDARDPLAKIFLAFARRRRDLEASGFALGSPLGNLAAELSESHPQVREKIATIYGSLSKKVESLLIEAGDRIPADVDRAEVAHLIVASLEGAVIAARAQHSIEPFAATVNRVKDYLRRLTEAEIEPLAEGEDVSGTGRDRDNGGWRSW